MLQMDICQLYNIQYVEEENDNTSGIPLIMAFDIFPKHPVNLKKIKWALTCC